MYCQSPFVTWAGVPSRMTFWLDFPQPRGRIGYFVDKATPGSRKDERGAAILGWKARLSQFLQLDVEKVYNFERQIHSAELVTSIARRARGEMMDSRSSNGKGERATECCLGKIWQSTARGTAGVAHTWLRFVVSSDDRPCCDTGRMTSASLDEWISVGAIVLDSYDTRESNLKPVEPSLVYELYSMTTTC